MFSSKNLPIMPTLCSKLAYYAGIMLDALACLLCLKLCRHNRRMPSDRSDFRQVLLHCYVSILIINGIILLRIIIGTNWSSNGEPRTNNPVILIVTLHETVLKFDHITFFCFSNLSSYASLYVLSNHSM